MTDRTLREKIEGLPRFDGNGIHNLGALISRYAVLALLDAHPAPPVIADAPVSDRLGPDAVAEARQPMFDLLRSHSHPGVANYRKERLLFNVIDMAGEHRGEIAMTQDERDAVGGIMFAIAKGQQL